MPRPLTPRLSPTPLCSLPAIMLRDWRQRDLLGVSLLAYILFGAFGHLPLLALPNREPLCSKPALENTFLKSFYWQRLSTSVAHIPTTANFPATKRISRNELQRDAHSNPAPQTADPKPGTLTVTTHPAPAACPALC